MTESTPSEPSLASWMREARERLDAATPGPWETTVDLGGWSVLGYPRDYPHQAVIFHGDTEGTATTSREDAEFIAHAPEDLRRALDALERVEDYANTLDGIPMLMQIASGLRAALSGRTARG